MSYITDDLRKYAGLWDKKTTLRDNLYRLADGIDIKLDKLGERYEALPADADDIPVRVGDKMTNGVAVFVVAELSLMEGGWAICDDAGNAYAACDLTHYKTPSVESLLREFAEEWYDMFDYERDVLIAEYADKIKLAGDDK